MKSNTLKKIFHIDKNTYYEGRKSSFAKLTVAKIRHNILVKWKKKVTGNTICTFDGLSLTCVYIIKKPLLAPCRQKSYLNYIMFKYDKIKHKPFLMHLSFIVFF